MVQIGTKTDSHIKLIDYPDNETIWRGTTIIRCRGLYPYESVVDFLVCETIGQKVYTLTVASGYKSGSPLIRLPLDSLPDACSSGIKVHWLKTNWYKWIYPQCLIEDVWLIRNRNIPKLPKQQSKLPKEKV